MDKQQFLASKFLLKTERFSLLRVQTEDINFAFQNLTKEEICRHFSWDEDLYKNFEMMYQQGTSNYQSSMIVFFILDANGANIGEIGFHSWNKKHHKAELFYKIFEEQNRQKGYVGEAVFYVLRYGFEAMNLHRIQALVAKENLASKAILAKYNFLFEGLWREDYWIGDRFDDSEGYSLLKPEWQSFSKAKTK